MTDKPITYVALLRGINVGGKTMIPMAELRICFEKLGYQNVRTYINSGNVIFHAQENNARTLETTIERSLTRTFGHTIAVVVRSFEEIAMLIKQLPKSWHDSTDQKCNVIFLRHTIDNEEVLKELRPKADIEELHYHPGVLFWSAKTSDLTKSNMVKLSRHGIYKEMTIRNLNTARKLYELMKPEA